MGRWKYVPLIGLVVAFVRFMMVTSKRPRDKTWRGTSQTIWEAFDEYHVALATTLLPCFAIISPS